MTPLRRSIPRSTCLAVLVLAVLPVVARAGPTPPPARVPVTAYDFATRDDLLFAHMLGPLVRGEVGDWPILAGLGKQLGGWVDTFLDAGQVANIIAEAFPIEGQPALRPLERVVERCAGTLGLPEPLVHVRNSPLTQAYVVRAFGRDHLVVTSGLLDLFADRPDELGFVVGHELGHVLCGHLELKGKAFGLMAAARAINEAVIPDRYSAILPTLGLGRLYTWCRESEISADRAGLLCCGEPKVAYQAIMRLHHGLAPGSPWIDPDGPDFDANRMIKDFRQWQYRPFVELVLDLKRHSLAHPFVPERLAALKAWADMGVHREILARRGDVPPGGLIEVVQIQAFELAPEGRTIDPYVIVFDGDRRVLRTATASGQREAQWRGFKSTDKGVDQPRAFDDGRPLFFEVWDDNYTSDTFVGGFVVYPRVADAAGRPGDRTAQYTAPILWDWKEPQPVARPGFARVTVRFLDH